MNSSNKMKIEIWSDIACPFCYIGKAHLEKALKDFEHKSEVEIKYYSYQLDTEMKYEEGQTAMSYLVKRKGMQPEQLEQMTHRIEGMAEEAGIKINFKTNLPANTLNAHRIIHLAQKSNKDKEVMDDLFKAHFTNGENIEDTALLTEIGLKNGLKKQEISELWTSDKFMDDVQQDISEGFNIGVQGVPFFVLNRKYGISGAQPVEVFKNALNQSFDEWRKDHPSIVSISGTDEDNVCGPDGCSI